LATLLFSTAFFAIGLGNVLFLTGVWQWSVLHAAAAILPAPLTVALAARPAGRRAARLCPPPPPRARPPARPPARPRPPAPPPPPRRAGRALLRRRPVVVRHAGRPHP